MSTPDASRALPDAGAPSSLGHGDGGNAEPYACEREIRLAVVMYGGVSLCIYINGVAQELLQLVRATALKARGDKAEFLLGEDDVAGTTAEVYRRLGDELKARFTIDVLSGTSAGGINAVFLAKALANDGSLDGIEQLWMDEGDIDVLVNDAASERDLPVTSRELPASLLNGRRMYIKLLEALDGMDAKARAAGARGGSGKGSQPADEVCGSTLVDELDLFVTSTDLRGIPVPLALSDTVDNVVFERRHKNVTQFTYLPTQPDGDRNDFCQDNNPFLAFAARCTSAFPFAFEPMCLTDVDEVLERSPIYGQRPYCRSHSKAWRRFYQPYLEPIRRAAAGAGDELVQTLPFSQRAFGDGGYLDNKPFSYAIDTLLKREAVLPVLRKLVYIEPSPEHPENDPILEPKPDALENSLSALTSIPRYESIREDLQRVMTQNDMRVRVNRILEAVMEGEARDDAGGHAPESGDAYLRLRAATAVEEVAKVIAWMLDIDQASLAFVGIRCLVRVFRNRAYATGAPGKEYAVRMFLADFDVSFDLRRLRFLLRKLAKLVQYDSGRDGERSDDERALLNAEVRATFAAVGQPLPTPQEEASFRPDLYALQAKLFGAYSELRRLERRLASRAAFGHGRSAGDEAGKLSSAISSFANESGQRILAQVLATHAPRPPDLILFEKQCLVRAEEALEEPAVVTRLEEIAGCYKAFIQTQREASARQVMDALHGGSIAAQLLFGMWRRYEDFDRVLFPILYDTDAREGDPIAIVRISPDEASSAGARQRPVLKGEGFGHFGAFLERSWRRHDILWGRLHAAERIIQMLLPDPSKRALRDQLIERAHELIRRAVEPELRSSLQLDLQRDERLWRLPGADRELLARALIAGGGAAGSNAALLDAYLRSVPSEPDRRRVVRLVGRSTIVIGQILERIAEKYHAEGNAPRKWLTRFGRLLIGLAEVASPRSPFEILYKYWLWLAYVFALLLIALGALLGKSELVNVALVALAITAFAHFAQWSTYLYFVPLLPWRRARTVLSIAPVAGIFALAIAALHQLEVAPVVKLVGMGHAALSRLDSVIASQRQDGWSGLELDLLAFCVLALALVGYAIWLHRRSGSIRAPRWSAAFPDAPTSPLLALRFAQTRAEVEALVGPERVAAPELKHQAQRELGFQALATAVLGSLAIALGWTALPVLAGIVATLALAAGLASIFEYRQTVHLLSGATAGSASTAAGRPIPAELASLARYAAAKWALLCAAAAVAGLGLLELGYSELWSGLLPHLAGYLVMASGAVGIFATTRSRSGARRRLPWLRPAQAGLTVALVVLIALFLFQPPRERASRTAIETQIRALSGSEK